MHRGIEHGHAVPPVDADSCSSPAHGGAINCGKRQNEEDRVDAGGLRGSAFIRSNLNEGEVPEAGYGGGRANTWEDNSILSCLDELCKTFSPLAKSIDYVHSDLMSIAKEKAALTEVVRRQRIEVLAEKQQRARLLQQETRRLENAKLQLQQEKKEIAALESQILGMQARIQLIMRGATDPEEVTRFAAQHTGAGLD